MWEPFHGLAHQHCAAVQTFARKSQGRRFEVTVTFLVFTLSSAKEKCFTVAFVERAFVCLRSDFLAFGGFFSAS